MKILTEDYKNPECGKPSIFVGERQNSVLVLLKNSSRSRVINESLHKLRGLVILSKIEGFFFCTFPELWPIAMKKFYILTNIQGT